MPTRILHVTLPMPVPGADGLLWAVWYCPTEVNADTGALRLGVPVYGISFRADFGAFAELRACAAPDFGLPDSAAPWRSKRWLMT